MGRVSSIKTNFTGGQVSPRLYGRVDFDKLQNSAKQLQNVLIYPHGGATRRPGTFFIDEVKDSDKNVRLWPFEFSTIQSYVLEFGDQYMRVYRDRGQVQSGGSPYELVTPFLEADLPFLQFAQDADTLFVVHPDYEPRKITRTADDAWTIEIIAFIDGPYLPFVAVDNELKPSALTGSMTLTADQNVFNSNMVGTLIRWYDSQNPQKIWWFKITGYTNAKNVTATFQGPEGEYLPATSLDNNTKSGPWQIGAFSEDEGYPQAIGFFEQRLILGGTDAGPHSWYASVTDDFENFSPGAEADRGLSYTLASGQVNAIRWIQGARQLFIGTLGGEWVVQGQSGPMAPDNIDVKQDGARGSELVQAVLVGTAAIFIERQGRKVREQTYDFDTDSFLSRDLSLLAENLTKGVIKEIVYQQTPDNQFWVVLFDGSLLTATYYREENVIAWSEHVTDGAVESVAVIPGANNDDVYIVVRRYVNGEFKRYVEHFTDHIDLLGSENLEDAIYLDSALTYDGRSLGIIDSDCSDLTGWTDNDTTAGGGAGPASTQVAFDGMATFKFLGSTTPGIGTFARRTNSLGAVINDYTVIELRQYLSQVGARTDSDHWELDVSLSATLRLRVSWSSEGLQVYDGFTWNTLELEGETPIITDQWQTWKLLVDHAIESQAQVTVQLEGVAFDSAECSDVTSGLTVGDFSLTQYGGTTANNIAYVDTIVLNSADRATTLTGLGHLEGKTVQIFGDGAVIPSQQVVSGQITLDEPVAIAHVGLEYDAIIETLPIEAGAEDGVSHGKVQRLVQVVLELQDSGVMEVGPSVEDLTEEDVREASDPMSSPLPLINGAFSVSIEGTYDRIPTFVVAQRNPIPLSVSAMTILVETEDI